MNAGVPCLLKCLVGLIAASVNVTASDISPVAISFLQSNTQVIHRAAASHQVPATAIAAAIAAEMTLNTSAVDRVQDKWLKSLLATNSGEWWQSWETRCGAMATRAANKFMETGKWPQQLIMEGYTMSFGPAQISPRTLISAVRSKKGDEVLDVQSLMKNVFESEGAIDGVALIMSWEASKFSNFSGTREGDIGRLGTLFSFGADRLLRSNQEFSSIPVYDFGRWMNSHAEEITELLNQSHRN